MEVEKEVAKVSDTGGAAIQEGRKIVGRQKKEAEPKEVLKPEKGHVPARTRKEPAKVSSGI